VPARRGAAGVSIYPNIVLILPAPIREEKMGISKYEHSPTKYAVWKDMLELTREKPKWVLGFLGIQFLIVLISYATHVELIDSIKIAILFTIFWLIIYIGLPALLEFVIGLAMLVAMIGVTWFIVDRLGGDDIFTLIIAVILAIILISIVLFLLYAAMFLAPGIIAYQIVFQVTDSKFLSIAAFIVALVITALVLIFIFEILLPFLYRFGWTWFSYGLANTVAVGFAIGMSTAELLDVSTTHLPDFVYDLVYLPEHLLSDLPRSLSPLARISDLLIEIIDLVRSVLVMPTLVGIWAFLVSLAVGVYFLNKSHPEILAEKRYLPRNRRLTGTPASPAALHSRPPASHFAQSSTQASIQPSQPAQLSVTEVRKKAAQLMRDSRRYLGDFEYEKSLKALEEAYDLVAPIDSVLAEQILEMIEPLKRSESQFKLLGPR
jgi:hypothetical protein